MGMDVIAYTATPKPTEESRRDHGFVVPGTGDPDGSIPSAWYSGLDKSSLHSFLEKDIDHLVIAVPLTEQTTHFLGREEFEIFTRTRQAFLSNISRGKVIKQDDLIDALKKGLQESSLPPTTTAEMNNKEGGGLGGGLGLGGAALDVTDPEPLPEDNELWTLPNAFISPHISWAGTSYVDRAFRVFEVNLDRLERGRS